MVAWLKEWALFISAGVTLLLAIAAFWAIWQNHLIQKRERKERLLNEIIEWAVDILSCGHETEISSVWTGFIMKPQPQEKMRDILISLLQDKFRILEARGSYIWRIVLQFGADFQQIVLETTLNVSYHLRILQLDSKGKLKHLEAIGRHRQKVDSNARDVIRYGTNILKNL